MEKLEPSILRKYLTALMQYSTLKAVTEAQGKNLDVANEYEVISNGCKAMLRHVPYSVDNQLQFFTDEIQRLERATQEIAK